MRFVGPDRLHDFPTFAGDDRARGITVRYYWPGFHSRLETLFMRRRFGYLRLIGQLLLLIIGVSLTYFLGRNVISGAKDLSSRWQARTLHDQQKAVFPAT